MSELEPLVGRVLTLVTRAGVALIAVGVALMVAQGVSPLDPAPSLDPAGITAGLAAGRPAGPIGLGIATLVAGPVLRVVVAGIGYAARGERRMAGVATAIVGVIVVGVVVGLGGA